jgi:hypothetical protein
MKNIVIGLKEKVYLIVNGVLIQWNGKTCIPANTATEPFLSNQSSESDPKSMNSSSATLIGRLALVLGP